MHDSVGKKPASIMLLNFLDAYTRLYKRDHRFAKETLAHVGAHLMTWAARTSWCEAATSRGLVEEGVRLVVGSRNEEFLAQSLVKGLLP